MDTTGNALGALGALACIAGLIVALGLAVLAILMPYYVYKIARVLDEVKAVLEQSNQGIAYLRSENERHFKKLSKQYSAILKAWQIPEE